MFRNRFFAKVVCLSKSFFSTPEYILLYSQHYKFNGRNPTDGKINEEKNTFATNV